MWLFVVAFVLFLVLQCVYIPSVRTAVLFSRLPGPTRIPLLGMALDLLFVKPYDLINFIGSHCDKYNQFLSAYVLGIPCVFMQDPDDIKVILSSNVHIDKGVFYDFLKTGFERGLLLSNGDKWRNSRRLLNPTFHNKILEEYIESFGRHGHIMTQRLLEDSTTGPIVLKEYLFPCAIDIIAETTMGISLNTINFENRALMESIQSVFSGFMFRLMNPYLKRDWMWKLTPVGRKTTRDLNSALTTTRNIFMQRVAEYNASKAKAEQANNEDTSKGKKLKPFLEKLLDLNSENPGEWDMEDIMEQVNTMVQAVINRFIWHGIYGITLAGHETSSGSTIYALWALGHNPDIQEKAYQELYEIFGVSDRPATKEDLQKMVYLEKIIKETMRLYPIIPLIMRQLNQDLKIEGKPLIPAGANVIISPLLLHRSEKFFPDPDKFDPERFNKDECAARHPFAYIPFSAGPRNCIGYKFAMLEIKVVLSTVLRACKVSSITKVQDVKFIPAVVLHPTVPIEVRIEPRVAS